MQIIKSIQNRIYQLRGERVMLDFDLALLYEVPTKVLNQAVKRNIKRFPEDFMFQLSEKEWQGMRHQVTVGENEMPGTQMVTLCDTGSLRSPFVTLNTGRGKHSKYLPYAFTEQGIAMLSGVLHSEKAISMNIAIMRSLVNIRKIVFRQSGLKEQLKEIREWLGEHDVQLNQIYDAMENLLDEKAGQRKWEDRERIGFRK